MPAPPAKTIPQPLRHLAVIVDGNRRWALQHDLPAITGYRTGGQRVLELLTWCDSIDEITTVTLWSLSTENLRRGQSELADLLSVITETTEKIAATQRWQVRLIGSLDRLPEETARSLRDSVHRTRHITGKVVNVAVAYGGRDEIARAVQSLVLARQAAGDLLRTVHPEEIGAHLDTAGQPDPDLVIRTAGEQRLSGFMPWQTAYSEFSFTSIPWPAFTHSDFLEALAWYRRRTRRYGT
ncbi:polyprenyl diphosphate synthase [Streptomyces sp. NBC_01077]|uniref:polyprenyl diphosphate synthase n=1 Tax=Streptomyces sp. NBC_01077 TaxID=2903746 RepID=UPI003868F8D8|nr:polyprenyl diphosphate synthase [Streptomyces sp. NBC_01077]WSV43590.1 polyprenyl diphosphate synthase [Streptomyces sp. NBC_01077]